MNATASADMNDLRVRDVDELSRAVSGADLELVQLCPGVLRATVTHRRIGQLSVDQGRVNLPLRVRGRLDPLRYAIGVFDQGTYAMYNGNHVDASKLLYFMPGRELDGYFRAPYGWTSLLVPGEWIEQMSRASRCEATLHLRGDCRTMQPGRSKLAALRSAIASVGRLPAATEESGGRHEWAVNNLRNLLGEALMSLDEPSFRRLSNTLGHFSTARRAERHMRERMDETLCVDDLCIALRVSRRYLEYAFNDAFGTSPSRYLRLLRLHEVRRRLKKPEAETTVTREALRLGFNHLSLFSFQYRKTFGENPSATLSAAQP